MAPSNISSVRISGRTNNGNVDLVVESSSFGQELPMSWASRHVEGSGIDEEVAAEVPRVDLGQVRKPDFVANPDPDLGAKICFERGKSGTGRKNFRLLECHLP